MAGRLNRWTFAGRSCTIMPLAVVRAGRPPSIPLFDSGAEREPECLAINT
jgi:hypothetical protein